ncbi:LOW QUALITY PROTEIN: hypothetical protein U0070_018898 [Myodes glareolus]|uniref:Uncharacterized protein n=1 Tax=Myodes glareolus TaxID=447135 RepID=A0AAW0JU01_MYOGA
MFSYRELRTAFECRISGVVERMGCFGHVQLNMPRSFREMLSGQQESRAIDNLLRTGIHIPTKWGAGHDGQTASFLLFKAALPGRIVTSSFRVGGGMRLTPSPGARLGGPLGVGRLRGRGWRRPRWRRLRDEREESRELREMGRFLLGCNS